MKRIDEDTYIQVIGFNSNLWRRGTSPSIYEMNPTDAVRAYAEIDWWHKKPASVLEIPAI